MDEFGKIVTPPTQMQQIMGTIYTLVYSIVVIMFGTAYKVLAKK